jgi:hypothetical protein
MQGLLVDREVARRGEQRREVWMSVVDGGGADEPVPDPPVPRLEELLARMLPLAREQELELHGTPSALAVELLGEGDEGAADAGAALLGAATSIPNSLVSSATS